MKQLPNNVKRIDQGKIFSFGCHPSVACFTDCCRQLELALTPYDVLRLKKACGLDSEEFLDRYVIMEQEQDEDLPRFYLTMVDDGQASCVFVARSGCTLYQDRPGACRAYPMGRAAICQTDDSMDEFYVLLQENHCLGFQEKQEQNVALYSKAQGLVSYNQFNDAVAPILQHEQIRQGKRFSTQQREYFILALYNLDQFRRLLMTGQLPGAMALDDSSKAELANDEALLLYGISWLTDMLFNN